ncbi:MAG: DUF2461 domain-containing protein [Acidimicrobiia bacterium]|nr:DUF2461 domain-containing protein [Acidimicrobiia bacterium]
MAQRTYFTSATFTFLRDLEGNNKREWFKANKGRYDATIKEPALDFIEDFAKPLSRISPHFVADPSLQGGSLFRIYRDTRFSKDKTPYKTNTGLHFRHFMAKDAHAPGFYLHIQPGENFMGVGLWRPETKVAYQIREHIAEHPAEWKKASRGKRFADVFSLEGDSLTRPPKGFDADHPLIEDLKRKDFIASTRLTQKDVTSSGFMKTFESNCKRAAPFMKFLCDALGVPF